MKKALPLVLLLLATSSTAQEAPSPEATQETTGPWELVDGVAAQAGDRILRTRDYLKRVNTLQHFYGATRNQLETALQSRL